MTFKDLKFALLLNLLGLILAVCAADYSVNMSPELRANVARS